MQQADELLTYFACHSRQGKRYGLIVKRLTRVAVEYHHSLQQRQLNTRSLKMPEIFRLNLPPLKVDQLKPVFEINVNDGTYTRTRERSMDGQEEGRHSVSEGYSLAREPLDTIQLRDAGRETQPNTVFQNSEGQDISPMLSSSPLPDPAQASADTGQFFELADLTSLGDLEDFHVDLERAGDIWALDWGDPLL